MYHMYLCELCNRADCAIISTQEMVVMIFLTVIIKMATLFYYSLWLVGCGRPISTVNAALDTVVFHS